MDWEGQLDSFMSGIQRSWASAREDFASGITLGTKAEMAAFRIHDPDITRASEAYFSALAIFTPVSDQLETWQKSLSSTSASISAFGDSYAALLGDDPNLAAAIPVFVRNAQSVSRSVDNLVQTVLPHLQTEVIAPMGGELKRLNELRSRALRLQYKVEQLEKAYSEKALKAVIDKANPQWLEKARAALAIAKPAFVDAITDFELQFNDWKARAYGEFAAVRNTLVGGFGDLEFVAPSEGTQLDFSEVDAALAAAHQDGTLG